MIGVQDKTLAVTGIRDFASYTVENMIHRILGKTPSLPSLGLLVEALQASDTKAIVWLAHLPRHAPRQAVQAHDKAWQRDGDSLVELRADRHDAILREHMTGQDWSAGLVPDATLADLDKQTLQLARKQFTAKNSQERWAGEIALSRPRHFLTGQNLARAKYRLEQPCYCWENQKAFTNCSTPPKWFGACLKNAHRTSGL